MRRCITTQYVFHTAQAHQVTHEGGCHQKTEMPGSLGSDSVRASDSALWVARGSPFRHRLPPPLVIILVPFRSHGVNLGPFGVRGAILDVGAISGPSRVVGSYLGHPKVNSGSQGGLGPSWGRGAALGLHWGDGDIVGPCTNMESWVPSGTILGPSTHSGVVLESSWGHMGSCWDPHGSILWPSWDHLWVAGVSRGHPKAVFGSSRAHWATRRSSHVLLPISSGGQPSGASLTDFGWGRG